MKSDVENTDSLSKCNQHLENCIRDLDWEVTSPEDMLSWATKEFGSRAVLATSFQRSGMVMFHMAYSAGIPLRIATIDTMRLHDETYSFIKNVEARYGLKVER